MVRAVLEENEIELIDMTFDLPATHFSDKGCACEHLMFEGRQHVASRLSAALANFSAVIERAP